MKKRRGISQSAINLYRNCPFSWYLKYIENREPMFWDHSILDVGSIVHDTIDSYYRVHFLMDATADDILLETYNILKNKWDTYLLPEQLKKAYICLQNFSKWEHKNLLNRIRTKPSTEQKIDACGFYGIIDYVDINNDEAVDWKTNTYPSISRDYKIQAVIYRKLYQTKFNKNLKQFKFYFLYPDIIKVINYCDYEIRELTNEVIKIRDEILDAIKTDNFPKKSRTPNACKNCLYRFYCIKSEKNGQTDI